MRILVFLHGTVIMHKNAQGVAREGRVKQVVEKEESIRDYASYVPIGDAVRKLQDWKSQGAEILYLSAHRNQEDVEKEILVLKKHGFPDGRIYFRQEKEEYRNVAERLIPDVLIEDDCESIGGEKEMVYPQIRVDAKAKIKSIVVKEFGGIDSLPDKIYALEKA